MANFFLLQSAVSADTTSVFESAAQQAQVISHHEKFWLIEKLWRFLKDMGIGSGYADLITFSVAAAVVAVIIWLVDLVIIKATLAAIKARAEKSKTTVDDVLVEQKVFSRLTQVVPLMLLLVLSRIIFQGFDESFILYVRLATYSIMTFVLLLTVYALLNSWNVLYDRNPQSSKRPIKGYIQVAKIVLGFLAGIVIISILFQKDPSNLFVGLGATAALFTLVFKDTILGFVASIQLSAQDMVRPGDWIAMPSKDADGVVLDINVNSVKVQNWDNTITMIPIYTMVTESFTNWRGMERSDGRRFIRQFYIDLESVVFASEELIYNLEQHAATASNFTQTMTLAKRSSSGSMLTNLALFRAHMELYLKEHSKINEELPLYARYTQDVTEKGVQLQLYAFSREKAAQAYDEVHRSVVEYTLAASQLFGIRFFQSPTGVNMRQMGNKQ